jgi:hypothetical protein
LSSALGFAKTIISVNVPFHFWLATKRAQSETDEFRSLRRRLVREVSDRVGRYGLLGDFLGVIGLSNLGLLNILIDVVKYT